MQYLLSNGERGDYVEPERYGLPHVEVYPGGGVAGGPTFNVEYLDVTNATGIGFDDPTLARPGATRWPRCSPTSRP